ncbi:hypothetical protein TREPR_0138 [Treponema primitia ZAS-2]|uniref:Uncharacterized protein n=1 Tax=Treponema primitia (strain ATCC BAA-887 / DSM 12427 / ZAS-2) TaxID=545694 RepID=F5YMI2_TREPZ|nr:hypothetical protein [Treponema primitia]AEF85730.1 hypothetical protein TREPR_0138 [Treponema primitia ZAS-2]
MKIPVTHFAGAILAAVLCTGCASLGPWKDKNFSFDVPMGIVAVVSNYNIYWDDEDPTSSDRPGKNENPEKTKISRADVLIEDAEAILRQTFVDLGVSNIVPKEKILESQAYKNAPLLRAWKNKNTLSATGYRPINYKDKNFAAALAAETEIKAGLYISFDFSKVMASGMGKSGTFRTQVNMKVIIVDERGKIVYNKNRLVISDDKIRVALRVFNQEELLDLFRSTLANACYLFLQEFVSTDT